MTDTETGAILTPSMREFYREDPEATGSKARSIRQRTRDRIVAALGDVELLSKTLRDEDRRAIVDRIDARELDDHLERIITLFTREIDIDRIEKAVGRGVQRGIAMDGYPDARATVRITIDRESTRMDELLEKWERTGEVPHEDLREFLLAKEGGEKDRIPDDLWRFVAQNSPEGEDQE